MKDYKRLKDPIYGYIEVPSEYMHNIVDSSSFQRLRRIIQTSYSPLYASAVHNRFVHSLGVYHLSGIASNTLKQEIEKKVKDSIDLNRICVIFRLACLLHDVGHAPFSHTGEDFFLDIGNKYDSLHSILVKTINSKGFETYISSNKQTSAAKSHEIISAIIGIKEYPEFFSNSEEKEFFARCITGYTYTEKDACSSLKNCFISLLNSELIDVDKLDYLLRDAYITGYDTVNIDYERLLKAITIYKEEDGNYKLAFYKDAISVIENVVYAHDAERKWIQNHPMVLYEAYILKHIISRLNSIMNENEKRLFSLETLSKTGQTFNNNLHISLMCDDDIIFLMKNVYLDDLSKEFFERKERRHPLWKSEAEYKAYFLTLIPDGPILQTFEKAMELTAEYLVKNTEGGIISDDVIQKVKKDLDDIEKKALDLKSKQVQKNDKDLILKVMTFLRDYAKEKDLDCDFVILKASQFNSGFTKVDFSQIKIVFQTAEGDMCNNFSTIVSSYDTKGKDNEKGRKNFFYLFYKRKKSVDTEMDENEICRGLLRLFL